jgi:hypothetical protein
VAVAPSANITKKINITDESDVQKHLLAYHVTSRGEVLVLNADDKTGTIILERLKQ